MKNYEVTFIVDPVLSGDEIKKTAQTYVDHIKKQANCNVTNVDEMGLRQLAYPINRRNTGIYYCIEFAVPTGAMIAEYELQMRRDDNVLRFLTVALDKFGVKYNADKRAGLIGGKRDKVKEEVKAEAASARKEAPKKAAPKPAPKPKAEAVAVAAPAPKAEPVVATPAPEPVVATPTPEPVVATPTPEPVVATPTPVVEVPVAKDDLKKVEGIGPKIEGLLNDAGITTFAGLAATDVAKVKEILAAAGGRYASHNPTTWGQQAQMAADGKWDELKKWQDELDGGKVVVKSEEE